MSFVNLCSCYSHSSHVAIRFTLMHKLTQGEREVLTHWKLASERVGLSLPSGFEWKIRKERRSAHLICFWVKQRLCPFLYFFIASSFPSSTFGLVCRCILFIQSKFASIISSPPFLTQRTLLHHRPFSFLLVSPWSLSLSLSVSFISRFHFANLAQAGLGSFLCSFLCLFVLHYFTSWFASLATDGPFLSLSTHVCLCLSSSFTF